MAQESQIRGFALIFGNDALLLASRWQLLTADGYATSAATSIPELRLFLRADAKYDILVICHTVDLVETTQIQQELRDLKLLLPVYSLVAAVRPVEFLCNVARLTTRPSRVVSP